MTTAPTDAQARPYTPAAPPAARAPQTGDGSGLHTTRLIAGKTPADWAIHFVLSIVMSAALAVGTWSIYTLLTQQLLAPKPIAVLGSGLFDVAALFFALLSQRYAVTTDSGLAPRAAMLAMISTSSWVNWQHGQMEGWGSVGSVILAAAPVIAELSFEMFHRYAHREALRRLGRVAQALPVLGKWAWIFHPGRARRALDAHIRAALTEHEAVAERREEVAAERARRIVSVPAQPALSAHAQAATLSHDAQAPTAALAHTAGRPALTHPAEPPALNTAALNQDAQQPASTRALTDTPSAPHAQTDTPTTTERAQPSATPSERAPIRAQSAPSLTDRKALKDHQDALTLSLYTALNARPEWTEIRDALVSAGLESVSRPTAQRIRERVENAHPELTRDSGALAASN